MMMFNKRLSLSVTATLVASLSTSMLTSSIAHAWGDLGHQAVAQIAQDNLTPEARQGIVNILGPEPLALAAIWPDAVRDDHSFDPFKEYHYVEVPTGKSYETMPADEHAEKDALTVITQYPKLLRAKKLGRSAKMVALRYLIHVVGDVHQPLHVGNGVDMGGNLCEVKWSKLSSKPTKLHSTWDNSLVQRASDTLEALRTPAVKFYGYQQFAQDLPKANPLTVDQIRKIQDASPLEWIKESQALRISSAYPDETADGTPLADTERPYCKLTNQEEVTDPVTRVVSKKLIVVDGKYDATKIPTLSDEFKAKAEKIVEMQILVGGLRLAKVLNDVFGRTSKGQTPEAIIETLQLKNPSAPSQQVPPAAMPEAQPKAPSSIHYL